MSWGAQSDGQIAYAAWANLIEDALGDGNPAQGASYILFKSGSTYYARNGVDGTIGTLQGTNAATVLQNTIDACSAGDTVVLGAFDFDIGTTQIDASGVNLIGIGRGSIISYSGTDYAIKYDGTTTQQQYYTVGNFKISLSNNSGKGLLLIERCYYFNIPNLWVAGNANASNVGICLDGYTNGTYWNTIWGARIYNCGTGVLITTTDTTGANGNNIIGCIIRHPYSRGIDINDGEDTVILGGRVEGSQDNTTGIYINDDHAFISGTVCELTGTGADGIEITASADHTRLNPGRLNTTGYHLIDGGVNTEMRRLVVPFITGTAYDDQGWDVDAVGEYATAFAVMPDDLHAIIRVNIYAYSVVTEADAMRLEITMNAAASNEAYNTEAVDVVDKASATTNFAAGDIIYWTITQADDADVGHLAAGDSVAIKILGEDAGGDDCTTDARFRTIEFEYI